ncbi:MAG: beta-ketoacyl-[acyl-carrier-protein] synthase family protein [Pirellulales bacterium]
MSRPDNAARVVITGMGLVSPLGNSPAALWDALSNGRSGVERLSSLPVDNLTTTFAGEAREFSGQIGDFGPLDKDRQKLIRKALKLMCRETQIGVAAAQLALSDAGLPGAVYEPERIGVVFGSDYMMTVPDEFSTGVALCKDDEGKFDFTRWGNEGMSQLAPLWLLKYLPNMPASHVAIFNDLRGPSNSHTLREASSNLAIGEAVAIIQRGAADAIVAGAGGTRVHPLRSLHVMLQEQLANGDGDPAAASRPFDLHRTGMVIGEGAGAVVLERLETAQARGATIHAEVVGHGSSFVATRNMVGRCDRALSNVMRSTLRGAGMTPADVGHVHAHGLGTRTSDQQEAAAIGEIFGSRAERVPVVAAKSYFGNLGAGSGAVELIASVLALSEGKLFRTLNYETPDPECPIHVVRDAETPAGSSFLNVNVTPQGQSGAILVRKFVA